MKREKIPIHLFVMAGEDAVHQAVLEKHLNPSWQRPPSRSDETKWHIS